MQSQLVFQEEKERERLRRQNLLLSQAEKPALEHFFKGKSELSVLDIGCNDGTRTFHRFSDDRISRVIGSRPSLTVWLKNKESRAVFFHGAAFHGFLSVYGTHFHKVTNFPAIVFVWKSSCKSSRNPG